MTVLISNYSKVGLLKNKDGHIVLKANNIEIPFITGSPNYVKLEYMRIFERRFGGYIQKLIIEWLTL